MKNLKQYIIRRWYGISILWILVLGVILRFYDYGRRFGLGYDQAHDAVIAKFALENRLIPLVGPFSSAGPFQTGGEWYWFIMAGYTIFPFSAIAGWIFMTFVYVVFIYLIIKFAEKLVDRNFAIIAGVFSCISTAQIAQSTNLTNQGPLAIISLAALWFSTNYIKEKKPISLFLTGFFISLGVSIHLQGVALYSLLLFALIIAGKPKIKSLIFAFFGIVIPYVPIIVFDFQNDFTNISGMIQYFLYDQYKISLDVLGRRWLTYALNFWPAAWGLIIGGTTYIGYLIIGAAGFTILYQFIKRKLPREILFIIVSFITMLTILRYIRTPLYDSYLTFLHPFVLILTAWVIYSIFKYKKILAILLILLIVYGSIYRDIKEILYPDGITMHILNLWKKELANVFPDEKFTIYDFNYKYRDKSVPLTLFLYADGRISDRGRKIGLAIRTPEDVIEHRAVVGEGGYQLFDLSSSSSAVLEKAGWVNVNPSYIYNSTENWRKLSKE